MLIIAHRGNLRGPNKKYENKPKYVQEAIDLGYDVEVDLWYISGEFYLGHDSPDYPVNYTFLKQHALWIHCKNFGAYNYLNGSGFNYFFHNSDHYTLTSLEYIWCYPGMVGASQNTVCVLPELSDTPVSNKHYAVCTDYAENYDDQINFI